MPSPSLSSPAHVQLSGVVPSEQINDRWRIICVLCSPILCCKSLTVVLNGKLAARCCLAPQHRLSSSSKVHRGPLVMFPGLYSWEIAATS